MIAILLLHAVVGVALIAAGDRLGRRAFAVATVAPVAVLALVVARVSDVLDGDVVAESYDWVPQLGLTIDARLDGMGVLMATIVSGVGLLVCVYSLSYFGSTKPGVGRLAGLMTMFAGAMLGVVWSDHLLSLFLFWELTSITSYLLIGNDDENPNARSAALSAILITGMGGLVMLAGFVLVGQSLGTYRLSELGAAVDAGTNGTLTATGVALVLVGAFTKSAQLPFAGWLPGAMVAPTPISTYLHAATMVKAGVYLVARMAPLVGDVGIWRPLIIVVSGTTMIVGAWRALRQHDLKLLLAYGTVSQLGFMMLLFGVGDSKITQAAVVLILGHALFKAALFMVVGIVDHQCGTRDVRHLPVLGPGWRVVQVIAVVAAASMAGLPPLLGFIAKEKAFDATLEASFGGAGVVLSIVLVGSVLTLAYSARFVLGVFGRLVDEAPDADRPDSVVGDAPSPSLAFVAPAALLAFLSLVLGLAPIAVSDLVGVATTAVDVTAAPKPVVLWAGFNFALLLSAVVIALGATLAVLHERVAVAQAAVHRLIAAVPDSDRSFHAIVSGVSRFGRRLTSKLQSGSLPAYLVVIIGVAAIAPLAPLLASIERPDTLVGDWVEAPILLLVAVCAVAATVVPRRIAAALLLGGVGFSMAGFYVVRGAPDLALTQFAIETLATVLFVLVLRFLPRRFIDERQAVRAPIRLVVAGLLGVVMFTFALVASQARTDVTADPVSVAMLERSVPDGEGSNVVNVILVDFRGLDTLGEITVLVVAAIGLVALARAAQGAGIGVRRIDDSLRHLPVVDVSSRLLYPSILVLAVYFLFAGHNQPGGGFVAGLTAGAAISLRYVAGGVSAVRKSLRFAPWTVLGSGLTLASVTAIVPIVLGHRVLEHATFEQELPILGKVKATSALPFDIGVFLVVVGVILMAYEAFGDDIESGDENGADADNDTDVGAPMEATT